jgi:hypothetical protein
VSVNIAPHAILPVTAAEMSAVGNFFSFDHFTCQETLPFLLPVIWS